MYHRCDVSDVMCCNTRYTTVICKFLQCEPAPNNLDTGPHLPGQAASLNSFIPEVVQPKERSKGRNNGGNNGSYIY